MFSPYYAWARKGNRRAAIDHCAINVALYGPGARRWTMTERGRRHVHVSSQHFAVGPSALNWDGTTLTIAVDEVAMPLPRRVKGIVRLKPRAITPQVVTLAERGRHRWWPIAPLCDVEAHFSAPELRWRGLGYLDTNQGDEPIENGFRVWDWARTSLGDGAAIVYGGERRDGTRFSHGWTFGPTGEPQAFTPPQRREMPPSRIWKIGRGMPSEPVSAPPSVRETLEDTPFYARSLVEATLDGHRSAWMHESLSLDRFRQPIVQAMLPFRMPRRR